MSNCFDHLHAGEILAARSRLRILLQSASVLYLLRIVWACIDVADIKETNDAVRS